MNIFGCYVVFGEKMEPQVHLLNDTRKRWMDDGLRIIHRARDPEQARTTVMEHVFGKGARVALPAWSEECMVKMAQEYVGPHETMVRGLCAAIALGKPYSRDGDPGRIEGGGLPAPLDPGPPDDKGPSGALFSSMMEAAA